MTMLANVGTPLSPPASIPIVILVVFGLFLPSHLLPPFGYVAFGPVCQDIELMHELAVRVEPLQELAQRVNQGRMPGSVPGTAIDVLEHKSPIGRAWQGHPPEHFWSVVVVLEPLMSV
jgi:hypothetical protein